MFNRAIFYSFPVNMSYPVIMLIICLILYLQDFFVFNISSLWKSKLSTYMYIMFPVNFNLPIKYLLIGKNKFIHKKLFVTIYVTFYPPWVGIINNNYRSRYGLKYFWASGQRQGFVLNNILPRFPRGFSEKDFKDTHVVLNNHNGEAGIGDPSPHQTLAIPLIYSLRSEERSHNCNSLGNLLYRI